MRLRFYHTDLAIGHRTWRSGRSLPARRRYLSRSTKAAEQLHGGVVRPDENDDEASTGNPRMKVLANGQEVVCNEDRGSILLPLSPLMDPGLQAARNRHKTRKPEPSGELSDFQKKLSKNPYAQALATPVRSCAITGVRLPNYFLLGFGLAPHPKTGKPWQMPRLSLDPNVAPSSNASSSGQTPEQIAATPIEDNADTEAEAKHSGRKPAQAVAGSYMINQQSAMRLMSDIKRKSYMQMLPYRWKVDTRFKTDDVVWREDMDSFVLDLMRKKAVRLLKYLSFKPAAYVAACEIYQDVQKKRQAGAALWLGNASAYETRNPGEEPPHPYAMVKYRTACQIPVYNLPALLGPEYLHLLRESSQSFNGALVVIKQKRNTTETLMHLWKLMGYMVSEEDSVEQEGICSTNQVSPAELTKSELSRNAPNDKEQSYSDD